MTPEVDDVRVEPGHHVVQFYEHDETLALSVSSFLGAGLVAGETALVVATPSHRESFEAVLAAAGVHLEEAKAEGRYVALDARSLLDGYLVNGQPDAARFTGTIGALVGELAASGSRLRIYGEMVALLWDEGNVTGAIAVEALWNELGASTPFTLFCAYPTAAVAGSSAHDAICHHHSAVVPDPRLPPVKPGEVSRRFEPTAYAVPVARRFVRDTLSGWGQNSIVDLAELIVSELAGNAVRHSSHRFHVTLSLRDRVTRVAVSDLSPLLPTLRAFDVDATDGRGLHLIDAVSVCWGAELHNGAKTVWADLAEASGR